jgi:hypothetical protein
VALPAAVDWTIAELGAAGQQSRLLLQCRRRLRPPIRDLLAGSCLSANCQRSAVDFSTYSVRHSRRYFR